MSTTPLRSAAAPAATRLPFKVKDLALSELGRKEIRLAEQEMPGLMALREQYAASKPLAGAKIMGSLQRFRPSTGGAGRRSVAASGCPGRAHPFALVDLGGCGLAASPGGRAM
jgi:hypothetical protein